MIGHSNGYAPIEQYDQSANLSFSPTTDTYSLTATLYYLMSGSRPQTSTEIVRQGITIPATVPDKIKPIIKKGMSIKQSKRYGSGSELVSDLTDAYNVSGITGFINNVREVAKKRFAKKNGETQDDISVVAVDISPIEEETDINDSKQSETITPEIDNKSIIQKFIFSNLHKLMGWINAHPKFVRFGSRVCNIIIGISIVYGIFRCSYLIYQGRFTYDFYHFSCAAVILFIAALWTYITRRKKSKLIILLVSVSYALCYILPVLNDYSWVVLYLIGLFVIYFFYKLPEEIKIFGLCVFSIITMCSFSCI